MRTPSDSKLSLELTGNQGNVMKESMKCAKRLAVTFINKEKYKTKWDEVGSFGLHIHCPDAAMLKMGHLQLWQLQVQFYQDFVMLKLIQ